MSKDERLRRRLATAREAAEVADRRWRAAMAMPVDNGDARELTEAARRLHAVWVERERMRVYVADLERRLQRPAVQSRLQRLRSGASFLRWSVRQQARRSPVSG